MQIKNTCTLCSHFFIGLYYMSTSLSKFGFSTTDNIAGPRGPPGEKGDKGDQGDPGQDAIFPLDINGESIIGISSLSGAPNPIIVGAIDPIKINSGLDFMGTVIINLSEISGVMGEPIVIHSQVSIDSFSSESKFIRADDNKILVSSDIKIQDVLLLSDELLEINNRIDNTNLIRYRTYGPPSVFGIFLTSFFKLTTAQTAKGTKTFFVGDLKVNDVYKFSLGGIMTTTQQTDIIFSIFWGNISVCTFTYNSVALTNVGYDFMVQLTVTDGGGGSFNFSHGQGKFERSGFNTLFNVVTNVVSFGAGIVPGIVDIGARITNGGGSLSTYYYTLEKI